MDFFPGCIVGKHQEEAIKLSAPYDLLQMIAGKAGIGWVEKPPAEPPKVSAEPQIIKCLRCRELEEENKRLRTFLKTVI